MKKRVQIFFGVFIIILGVGIIFISIPSYILTEYQKVMTVLFLISLGGYNIWDAFANPDLADEQYYRETKAKRKLAKKKIKEADKLIKELEKKKKSKPQ